jgi:hypothetical protein
MSAIEFNDDCQQKFQGMKFPQGGPSIDLPQRVTLITFKGCEFDGTCFLPLSDSSYVEILFEDCILRNVKILVPAARVFVNFKSQLQGQCMMRVDSLDIARLSKPIEGGEEAESYGLSLSRMDLSKCRIDPESLRGDLALQTNFCSGGIPGVCHVIPIPGFHTYSATIYCTTPSKMVRVGCQMLSLERWRKVVESESSYESLRINKYCEYEDFAEVARSVIPYISRFFDQPQ